MYSQNPFYSITQKAKKLYSFQENIFKTSKIILKNFKFLLDFYCDSGYDNKWCRRCLQYVRVAQLDRATGYGPVGRGFESCHARVRKSSA